MTSIRELIRRYGLLMGVHELPSVVVVRGQRTARGLSWTADRGDQLRLAGPGCR